MKLVVPSVYYRVFDKLYQESSHIYSKHRLDDEIKVEQNRRAILTSLNANKLLILKQVHGNKVVDADLINDFSLEPEADAAITTKTGIVIAVQTADCVPVLLSDLAGKIVGGAHCGWRSAKADIIANVVSAMKAKGAKRLKAIIGPAVQQQSYEVDQNFYDIFVQDSAVYEKFFIPANKQYHYLFDLPSFVALKLQKAGIEDITRIEEDTYTTPEKYPSYRRSYHANEQYVESILSTIVIRL